MCFSVGQIVYSKCGRDRGAAFVIFSIDGDFAYLVNGVLRKIEKPKKKKLKHLQPVDYIDEALREKIQNNLYMNDSDVRKTLAPYNRQSGEVIAHG